MALRPPRPPLPPPRPPLGLAQDGEKRTKSKAKIMGTFILIKTSEFYLLDILRMMSKCRFGVCVSMLHSVFCPETGYLVKLCYIKYVNSTQCIVAKTCRCYGEGPCYLSSLFCYFLLLYALTLFFALCCGKWHIWWMNKHLHSSRSGQTWHAMEFNAIMRQISKDRFCAIILCELSAMILRFLVLCPD